MRKLEKSELPALLREIPDPPQALYIKGELPDENTHKFLSVVGSRKYSPYGKDVCDALIAGLRGYSVVVVSGLALGIDGIAHRAALSAGLKTIAVPGSGLDPKVLYPRTHARLAEEIVAKGGALVSEFEPSFKATPYSFPQRNRIMAGLSHATLLIEAAEKSGTLITARLASDYNRELGVVPGSIFSSTSAGTYQFLKLGATPITSSEDILELLSFDLSKERRGASEAALADCTPNERRVLELLASGALSRDELATKLALPAHEVNVLVSMMEIKGLIGEQEGRITKAGL